jgi:hypothetical protein
MVLTVSSSFTTGVECAAFVYTCELFPGEWRALGVSTSIAAVFWWSIFFTAAASPAFANIGALYYLVFISMTTVMVVIVILYFPNVSCTDYYALFTTSLTQT